MAPHRSTQATFLPVFHRKEVREMVQIKIRKLDKLETTGPRKPADG
ncbi:hypothetical protein [Streptomyces tanashiensis]